MLFTPPPINHCSNCGHAVKHHIPPQDNQPRAVCPACGFIQYQNPTNIVGTIPLWENQVLLCKRNIEPQKGLWTFPAGFLELGETLVRGASRETTEEAGAKFTMGALYAIMDVVMAGQVHFFYLAQLTSNQFTPGPETNDARLFKASELPWNELAFTTTKAALELYLSDLKNNMLGKKTHLIEIDPATKTWLKSN